MSLENIILDFIASRGAVFYSDISKGLGFSAYTVKDVVSLLEKEGKVTIEDKGIAKLVSIAGSSREV